ncbi:MAG: MarR family EPS-associated transcriptional regulator [Desulfobulbaceae bacterium]|nr:MarR family EPS-associated transcriptional regulator [Desulfobulbaceae bacterium]
MDDSNRYRLFKLLDEQPHLTQRELAKAMGVSLGKANYCLRALIEIGMIKASNFKNAANKAAYFYTLTPRGIEEKTKVTHRFLKRKMAEYESILLEIEELKADVQKRNTV